MHRQAKCRKIIRKKCSILLLRKPIQKSVPDVIYVGQEESNFSNMLYFNKFQHTGSRLYLQLKTKNKNSQLSIPILRLDDITVGETPNARD